jgi:hypothetical protein
VQGGREPADSTPDHDRGASSISADSDGQPPV